MSWGLASYATGSVDGDSGNLVGGLRGAGSLTKTGPGVLFLGGDNSAFFGTTTIAAGVLDVSGANTLAKSTVVVSVPNSLAFDGLPGTANFGGLAGAGNITLQNQNAVTLFVGGNNSDTTYSGNMSGTGSLIKVGSGTLTLTGVNNYHGGTEVNGGILAVATPKALAAYNMGGSTGVNGGGTLALDVGGTGWAAADVATFLTANSATSPSLSPPLPLPPTIRPLASTLPVRTSLTGPFPGSWA